MNLGPDYFPKRIVDLTIIGSIDGTSLGAHVKLNCTTLEKSPYYLKGVVDLVLILPGLMRGQHTIFEKAFFLVHEHITGVSLKRPTS